LIKLYLDLNTLNNQNEHIWSAFVNFVKEDPNYELIIDEHTKIREWFHNTGCSYVTYDETFEVKWTISYLSPESKDIDLKSTIFLVDSKNSSLLKRIQHIGAINIASLSTKSELQISNNVEIENFVLIILKPSGKSNKCNSKRVLISNNSNYITKSIESFIDLKVPTSKLYYNNDLIDFYYDDSTIIYDGEQAYEIHSIINSNKNSFIKNLNTSLELSVNRLSFDFNTVLHHFFIQSKTKKKESLRKSILKLFDTVKINREDNFLSLSEQLDNVFQNFVRTIDHFESKKFNYLNKFGDIDLLLAVKISKFKNNTSKTNAIQNSLFKFVFKKIINDKLSINETYNILQYLYSANSDLTVSLIDKYIAKVQKDINNDLVLKHIIWFYSSKFRSICIDSKYVSNNLFLYRYSKCFDDIIGDNYIEIENPIINKIALLLYIYSNLVFYSLDSILNNWSRINSIFKDISDNSSYKRINLIHEMYSNDFNFTNLSSLSSYGGITVVRNILYQYLFMSITNKNIKLFESHKKLVQSTSLNNSFDSLFLYAYSLHSLNTEIINNHTMDTNPWFDSNQLYCIIFCYKIFIQIKCNSGIQIIDRIADTLDYKIPKVIDVIKTSDNISVKLNKFEKLLLDYSIEYYEFIN